MDSKKPDPLKPSSLDDYEVPSFLSDESDIGGTLTWRKKNEPPGSLEDFQYYHIEDSFTSRSTLGSKSVAGQNHGSSNEVAEHVFYADPDFVTDSCESIEGEHGSGIRRLRQSRKGNFDLERWWLTAPLWIRLLPFLLFLFFGIAVTHLVFALICFSRVGMEWASVPDPYVCATPGCVALAKSMSENILEDGDPCTDFYEYACGGHVNEEEDPAAFPKSPFLTHAFQAQFLDAYLSA